MKTGPEHFELAERLLEEAEAHPTASDHRAGLTASAQVHATLALAAATVDAAPSSFARDLWGRYPDRPAEAEASGDLAQHLASTEKTFEGEFYGKCSCGWTDNKVHDIQSDAVVRIKEHLDATRTAANGVQESHDFMATFSAFDQGYSFNCSCGHKDPGLWSTEQGAFLGYMEHLLNSARLIEEAAAYGYVVSISIDSIEKADPTDDGIGPWKPLGTTSMDGFVYFAPPGTPLPKGGLHVPLIQGGIFTDSDGLYRLRAVCSCGWNGPLHDAQDNELCKSDANAHVNGSEA